MSIMPLVSTADPRHPTPYPKSLTPHPASKPHEPQIRWEEKEDQALIQAYKDCGGSQDGGGAGRSKAVKTDWIGISRKLQAMGIMRTDNQCISRLISTAPSRTNLEYPRTSD